MKTTIAFFLFYLFCCVELFASDYQTIYSNQSAIFNADGLRGMKIDSVKIQQNDSVFYPLKRILHDENGCSTPYGNSWLGEKIIISENWNNFINESDTVRIKTDAALDESWISYSTNDYTIKATGKSIDLQPFLGLEDSVKTISFHVYDKNNAPVEHLWNDKIVQISKNYGIIHGFDFFLAFNAYPYTSYQEYTLGGLSYPKAGIQNITWFDIWDFQPGNELHIYQRKLNFGNGIIIKKIIKYLYRENGENKISYKVEIKEDTYRRENNSGQSYEELLSSQHYETIEEIFPDEEFDKLPGEVILHENSAYTNEMSYDTKTSHNNEIHYNYDDKQCWSQPVTSGGCYYYYTKGLGGDYYTCDNDGAYISERSLVYHKKDGIEWGTPLTLSGIDEIAPNTSAVVYDKATETFLIDIEQVTLSSVFELLDTTGKTVILSKLQTDHSSIPVGHLATGVYIYRLTVNGKTIESEKIIK
jgi:hypothetical protein